MEEGRAQAKKKEKKRMKYERAKKRTENIAPKWYVLQQKKDDGREKEETEREGLKEKRQNISPQSLHL